MIYTVTFNPSLDYIVSVENFRLGMTNRTKSELLLPGGKGINVSTVLNNLGISNTALGFTAGFVGREIQKRVSEMGICSSFIEVENGNSRINVKLKDIDGTEINGMGPNITEDNVKTLMNKLDRLLKNGDFLVLAGSIPSCISGSIYRDIMEILKNRGVMVVVDATKDLLLNVLELKPFLIKPNIHELGEIFGKELKTRFEAIEYAKKLREMGAKNVMVSMSKDGAILISENGDICQAAAPSGKLVNAVGSGDSMVAGFIAGWLENNDYSTAFKMGLAAGSASAFSQQLATKNEILDVYKRAFGS